MKVIVIVALVAVSAAQCVDVPVFGAPVDSVDPSTRDITPKIIEEAKKLGSAQKVEVVKLSENTSTRYNLYVATLKVDGKNCTMTVSDEKTPKFLPQPDQNNCVLCC